jgi:hypothetical protein
LAISSLIVPAHAATNIHAAAAARRFLPAPDTRFRSAGSAHDLIGTDAVRAHQDNLSPPDVLMRRITIPRERGQAAAISGLESDGNSRSHPPDSHVSKMTLFASSSSGPQLSQYFIAAELAAVQPAGVTAVGRACNSYAELEMIAEEIRQDLESILKDAPNNN